MQGYNFNNKPNPPRSPFEDVSTSMQLDDGARTGVAQFFGDPQSRQFVKDSGGIQSAISRPDNPWGIPPVDSAIQGDPSATPPGAPASQPAAPAQAQATPPAQASPQGAPQGAPQPPAAPYGAPQASPATGVTPVASREDYLRQNPAPMPARPSSPWDIMSTKQKTLTSLFLAMNKLGGAIGHNDNTYADQFFGNVMNTRAGQANYDQNLPTMKSQAEDAWYQKYLGEQHQAADVRNMNSEIDLRNRGYSPQLMQMNQQKRQFLDKALDTWTKDPRFLGNPDSFRRAMQQAGQGLPIDPSDIEDIIKNQSQVSDKYSVDYTKEGGVPVGLIDNLGHKIPAGDIPSLQDDTASKIWAAAQSGHSTSVKEKIDQARNTAAARGDLGGYVQITNTKSGMSRYVNRETAASLTAPGGEWTGSDTDVSKQKGKWAMFGDVMDAANGLNSNLPQRALTTNEIAKISTAVQEYHGPIADAIKSNYLAGMKPDAANLAASLLSMRDNIIVLPSTLGIQPSDPRVQALWNAIPGPGDLKNPQLATAKMNTVYRMIHNLQEGLSGSAETFGVTPRAVGGPPSNMNQPQTAPTRTNQQTGEVQQQVNGQWVTVTPPTQKKKFRVKGQ